MFKRGSVQKYRKLPDEHFFLVRCRCSLLMQQNRSRGTMQVAKNAICKIEPFTWRLAAAHASWCVGVNVSFTRCVASASLHNRCKM